MIPNDKNALVLNTEIILSCFGIAQIISLRKKDNSIVLNSIPMFYYSYKTNICAYFMPILAVKFLYSFGSPNIGICSILNIKLVTKSIKKAATIIMLWCV